MLPVALNLLNRRVLIVGGGGVAARKATACLEAGADVTVISPTLIENFPTPIHHKSRLYQRDDCRDFDLTFAATNSSHVNEQVASDARSNKIWCNIADDPDASDFHTQSVVRRGQIEIGVSTGRLSPVLARHLRQNIEAIIGAEYEALQTLASEIEVPLNRRGDFWRAVLQSEVLSLLHAGKDLEARELMAQLSAEI